MKAFARSSVPIAAAAVMMLALATPAPAQTEPNDEARRFLVYPPNKILSFTAGAEGFWYLHYTGQQLKKGNGYYNQVIQVSHHLNEEQAVANCQALRGVPIAGKTIRDVDGYPCAFVQEHTSGTGPNATHYRSSWYAKGPYIVGLGEGAEPRALLPSSPPVGPLLAALNGDQPLSTGEVAFRNVLFRGLGFGGDTARACLDEVMNTAEAAAAKDAKMADDIARLRAAAAKVRAIEVLAAVPVGPDTFGDFDPKWWDALREVVPDPLAPPDPGETALDRAVDLLPPPLNVLVNIVRTGGKAMRTIKTHIADPATHAGIYACYRRQRAADQMSRIFDSMGQDALESAAAETLLDATVKCPGQGSFKNSYEPQLKGFKGEEARKDELKRLLRPAAVRFEFIYRVEDARQRKDAMIQERWAPVQGLLERLKSRVNACIADRASKSR